MGCGPKSQMLSGVGWTGQSSTDGDAVFIAFSRAYNVADYEQVRAKLEVLNLTSDVSLKRALQTSDDGVTWDAAAAFDAGGGWITAEGYDYPSAWTTISDSKQFFRVGILVKNSSASGSEMVRVLMTLDLDPR